MIEKEMVRISNDIARLQEGINHYGLLVLAKQPSSRVYWMDKTASLKRIR